MALPESDRHPFAEFLHELRRVRAVLGRAEERLGDVIDGIDGGTPPGVRRGSARAETRRARKYLDPKFRESAARGVGSVSFRRTDTGVILASFDGGREFSLSPALADLLAAISSADTAAPDGFARFQSLDRVVERITADGRRSSRRAVIVGVSRLRSRLRDLDYPPLLVETSVRDGVRFRLRMTPGGARG